MNRADRLRKLIPGADPALIAALAARPVAEVDLLVVALRQARRDGIAHEKARRAQRRADARKYHHYDEGQLAGRNLRLLDSTGRRATIDLAALEALDQLIEHAQVLRRLAVIGLHARGYADEEIAEALGITRQGVWKLRCQPEFAEDRASGDG